MRLPDEQKFTPAPAGAHRALCIGFIDLGTQQTEYQGNVSHKHQVQIRWELCDEPMDTGKLFMVVKRYNWSVNKNSTMRADLESWRGKPFEKGDFGPGGFDTRKLIGAPCLLTIMHRDSGGSIYANVTAISPLPRGMEKPSGPVNPTVYLSLDENYNDATYLSLSDKMRETIARSPEYKKVALGIEPEADEKPKSDPDMEDSIPF